MSGKKALRSAALFLSLVLGFTSARPAGPEKRGVLVLAHGGGPAWNETVRRTVEEAGLSQPVEIFYGMAVSGRERDALAKALADLKGRGASEVLAVPLLVSSHSEVYRQYQYLLGAREKPGFSDEEIRAMMEGMHHGGDAHAMDMGPMSTGPLTPVVPGLFPAVTVTDALDGAPEILDALKDRARALSRDASKEAVVLVAHGPNDDGDNALWLKSLEGLAGGLKSALGFAEVRTATLRDDAPPAVKDEATRKLREQVVGLIKGGKTVMVLPVLISAGGIEEGIAKRLEGLDCRIGAPLGGDKALSAWISRKAAETARPSPK